MSGKDASPERRPGTITAEALLRMDMKAAETLLNSLSLQQQQLIVLSAPWAKRQDIIMLSEEARLLVQELPDEEVYWMIKERGIEDSLPVISRTSQEQFEHITDIDCWDRDQLDPERCAEWLLMLSKCNENKVLEWLTKTDPEFLVLCFKRLMTVHKVQGDTDISEEYVDLPAFTIDNVYYCAFLHDGARQFIEPFLHLLFQHDYAAYTSLLEAVIWDTPAEVQDEAYRWRCSRIAEKGYPNFDEALALYRIMPGRELEALKCRAEAGRASAAPCAGRPPALLRFGFTSDSIAPYLVAVLHAFDDEDALDSLQDSIVALANKILVADVLDNRRSEDMRRALEKVLGYIAIALEDLAGGSIDCGHRLLATTHPEVLFNAGFTRIARLQQMIREHEGKIWIEERALFTSFFSQMWVETIDGILNKRPLCHDAVRSAHPTGSRDFLCLDDVVAVERIIETMQAAGHIICDVMSLSREVLLQTMRRKGVAELTCHVIFLTMLARKTLYGSPSLEPLSILELQAFLQHACLPEPPGNTLRLKQGFPEQVIQWLKSDQRFCHAHDAGADRFVEECLKNLEDEFLHLAGNKTIDYRYIHGILLQNTDSFHPEVNSDKET